MAQLLKPQNPSQALGGWSERLSSSARWWGSVTHLILLIVIWTATEQRRQEARASVRPVYDYNPALVGELKLALHDAFESIRFAVTQFETESGAKLAEASQAQEGAPSAKKPRRAAESKVAPAEALN